MDQITRDDPNTS
jgi:translation initiation factor 2-alpha kinase 4